MENKTFELLEKLYLEVQGLNTEVQGLNTKLEGLNTEVQEMKEVMVTKDDLKNFATKDDLRNLATKDDLELVAKQLHAEIQVVNDGVEDIKKEMSSAELITAKHSYDIALLKALRTS